MESGSLSIGMRFDQIFNITLTNLSSEYALWVHQCRIMLEKGKEGSEQLQIITNANTLGGHLGLKYF